MSQYPYTGEERQGFALWLRNEYDEDIAYWEYSHNYLGDYCHNVLHQHTGLEIWWHEYKEVINNVHGR